MLDMKDGDEEERKGALDRLDRAGPQASIAPIPPNPRATSTVSSTSTSHPWKARLHVHPEEDPDGQKDHTLYEPQGHDAREHPRRSAAGRMGVRESLSKKPLSMSRARSAPAVIAPKSAACTSGKANAKVEVRVGGEAGDVRGGVEAVGVDGEEHHRKQDRRDDDRRLP
jgi:hypothetical protein